MEEIPLSPEQTQSPLKITPRQPQIYSSQKKQIFSTPKVVQYSVEIPEITNMQEFIHAPIQPPQPEEPSQASLVKSLGC